MQLIELPREILMLIPESLHSIYDLYQLIQTCRTFFTLLKDRDIKLAPILPRPDGQYLMAPHPQLLLVGTVRQVADWAIEHPKHRLRLLQQLRFGYEGLMNLTQTVARVSLQDVRNLYELRGDFIDDVTDLIDYYCGPNTGVDKDAETEEGRSHSPPPWTHCYEPDQAVLNYLIYCELFHHLVDGDQFCRTSHTPDPKWLEDSIRLTFVAHCIPDENNARSPKNGDFHGLEMLHFYQSYPIKEVGMIAKHFYKSGEFITDAAQLEHFDKVDGDRWPDGEDVAEASSRCELFETLVLHMGADTLRLMLWDAEEDDNARLIERFAHLRKVVSNVSSNDLSGWCTETEHEAHGRIRTEPWPEWSGLSSDVSDSIWGRAHSYDSTVEDEAARWERELQSLIDGFDDAVQKELDS